MIWTSPKRGFLFLFFFPSSFSHLDGPNLKVLLEGKIYLTVSTRCYVWKLDPATYSRLVNLQSIGPTKKLMGFYSGPQSP